MVVIKSILNQIKKTLPNNEKILKYSYTTSGHKRKRKPRVYLTIQTNRRKLFIKYAPNENSDVFVREYFALTEVGSSSFMVPKPLKTINKGIIMSLIDNSDSLEKTINRKGLIKNMKLLTDAVIQISKFHKQHTTKFKRREINRVYKEITGKKVAPDLGSLLEQVRFGFTHGDLDPYNTCFISETGKFSLIDWEDFRNDGIQVLDAIHFVVMLGVITNPKSPYEKLYEKVFGSYINNPYLKLLDVYCKNSYSSLDIILKFIPMYCDAQNFRLIKADRDTKPFLYNKFREIYYERQKSI